jgi:hypothetical protein
METLKLRKKLINQFDQIIQDDEKLVALEGVLDALEVTNANSKIPDAHYDTINESREHYLKGTIKGISWEEVKQNLKSKYGL